MIDLQAAVEAVERHAWEQFQGQPAPWSIHADHNFDSGCKVCQGDLTAILTVAAPDLLAAERERIAKELEKAAAGGLIFTGTGHEVELLKAGSQARAHAFRDAAAIARGSVAGKPAGGSS